MKKVLLLICTTTIFFATACKSFDRNKHLQTEIPVEKLIKDINYVEKNLFKMHPKVDWYISKEQLSAEFDSLRASLKNPMKPNEFYFVIAPTIAKVRQGHMRLAPIHHTYDKAQKKKYKRSENPMSNIDFIYQNDKLYIKDHFRKHPNDSLLTIGSEVLDINGLKPVSLYNKYESTITADGYVKTMHPYYFARIINQLYAFELGYQDSLRWTLKCGDSIFQHTTYRIFRNDDFVPPYKAKMDSIYKSLTKEERKLRNKRLDEEYSTRYKKNRQYGWDYKRKVYSKELSFPVVKDSTVAVLTIRDFTKGTYRVYDEIFDKIKEKKVEYLIIDLRDNPGGRLKELHTLTKYLNDEPFTLIDYPTVNSQLYFFHNFRQKSPVFYTLAGPIVGTYGLIHSITKTFKDNEGTWRVAMPSAELTDPKPNAYKGKIYVITNGMTFSAASILAAHLEAKKNVLMVGEETGGTYNGTVAGQMPELKLPHSKLNWRLGLMTIAPSNKKEEGSGVQPRVPITRTAEQFFDDIDPEMDWILRDIFKQKNRKK